MVFCYFLRFKEKLMISHEIDHYLYEMGRSFCGKIVLFNNKNHPARDYF